MTATRQEALAGIVGVFFTAWSAVANSARAKFESVGNELTPPPGDDPWAAIVVRHATGNQRTLTGAFGTQRYGREGVVTVSIFQRQGTGTFRDSGTDIVSSIRDAFEGTTTAQGVIFTNVRINEVGPSGLFYQTNVLADFDYDQIR